MPSDLRLHPLSVVFGLGAQLRQLALPALALLLTARPSGLGWEAWIVLPIALSTLVAFVRYLTFRYRYEADHLVITDGLLFRNQRHIPYARIQNIDAIQNVLHRLAGVAEVRIETGAGQRPEATLDVLPLEALAEMRARVFSGSAAAAGPAAAAPARLLALDVRELIIFGLIHNRGLIVLGAIFGLLWEAGVMDRITDTILGPDVSGRGMVRSLVRSALGTGAVSAAQALLAAIGVTAFLGVVRVFSVGWALMRLYGFNVVQSGDDLRVTFGLLTQVSATIPLRRIQTVTIQENPFHRLFRRVTVRVETAGGAAGAGEAQTAQREWIAPVIRREQLPALLDRILPGVDLTHLAWQPPAAGAVRRMLVRWSAAALLLSAATARGWGLWALLAGGVLLAFGLVAARRQIAHLRWATGGAVVALRRGWLLRETRIARFAKIQVVDLGESPFDRRHRMASVLVDTAGGSVGSPRLIIPFMPRAAAAALHRELAGVAQRTAFEW